MTAPVKKPATYADIEALPPHVTGEIINGALHAHPRPATRHVTGPHVVVPDMSGWRVERRPADYGETASLTVPPDWICKVLSPSTESVDRVEKRRIYATYGVDCLWYVDPRPRQLEVFVRQDRDWLLKHTFAEDEDVCDLPFVELTFPLRQLWPFPKPADTQQS